MIKFFNFKGRSKLVERENKKPKGKVYTVPKNIVPLEKYRKQQYYKPEPAYVEVLSKREKKIRRKKRREIKALINLDVLKLFCNSPIELLMGSLGGVIVGDKDKYAYKNVGSDILAVAHTDTVQVGTAFRVTAHKDCTVICSPRLDDRLGVYTIMELLPKLGVHLDILLTENEERGRSTAKDFKTDKAYNWLVEFDRSGNDVVSYEYDFEDTLKEFFKPGLGTFTDISMLQELKVKAFNVGVGYQREHSKDAYFVLEQYVNQIERFLRFYVRYKDTKFDHVPVPSLFCGMQVWEDTDDDWRDNYRGHYLGNRDSYGYAETASAKETRTKRPEQYYSRYRGIENKYRKDSVVTFSKNGHIRIWCPVCADYKNTREDIHNELVCASCSMPVDMDYN